MTAKISTKNVSLASNFCEISPLTQQVEKNKKFSNSIRINHACYLYSTTSFWKKVLICGVVALAILFGTNAEKPVCSIVTHPTVSRDSFIPYHAELPTLTAPTLPAHSKIDNTILEYYQGKKTCFLINKKNAAIILQTLDQISEISVENPLILSTKVLKEKCQDVITGKVREYQVQNRNIKRSPIVEIPFIVNQMMHPGIVLAPNGKTGYQILNPTLATHRNDLKAVASTEKHAKNDRSLNEQIYKVFEEDGKGFALMVNQTNVNVFVRLNINSQKIIGHRKGMNFLRDWLIKSKKPYNLSPSEMEKRFKETYARLTFKKENSSSYRQGEAFVFKEGLEYQEDRDLLGMRKMLAKVGTKKDLKIFDKMFVRIMQTFSGSIIEELPQLTKSERAVIKKIAFVAPFEKELPSLMQQFIKDFTQKLKKMENDPHFDVIKFSAETHMKLVSIHPFEDGNGRFARAVMNGIFMRAGHEPVVFNDDTSYTQAVENDENQPGSFEKFLREKAIPWSQQNYAYLQDSG